MTNSVRTLVIAVAGALVLLGDLATASAAPLSDADARQHLEAMERQGVLRDSVWARAYWARSRQAPTPDARIADLRWTLRFDPELNAARWELTGALLRKLDPECSFQMITAFAVGLRSFPGQQRLMVWLLTVAYGATLGALMILTTIAIIRLLPRIFHAVKERLRFLPSEVQLGATLLTVLVPFALAATVAPTAALFWTLLLGTGGTWTMLMRRERKLAVATLSLLMLSPVALLAWSVVTGPGNPESYLSSLWVTQSGPEGPAAEKLRSRPPLAAETDPDYWSSLALLARRNGDYPEAAKHLAHAIELDPDEWAYRNNLGNVQLLSGDAKTALATYARARQLAPKEPLVLVNEAQAWVDQLEFSRASSALEEASRLGYRLPPLLNASSPEVIVRDRVLSTMEHWKRFTRGQGLQQPIPPRRILGMMLALPFPMKPFWISFPLWFALWYVALARTLPRAFHCDTCGEAICRKCHYRVQRRSLCSQCYAIRRDVKAPMKRLEMFKERRARVTRWGSAIGDAVSFLFPGAGDAIRGTGTSGLLLLMTALVLALSAGAGSLWPDPGDSFWSGPPTVVLMVLGAFYLILAIGSLRTHRRVRRRQMDKAVPAHDTTGGD